MNWLRDHREQVVSMCSMIECLAWYLVTAPVSEAGNRHESAVMAADLAAYDAMEDGADLTDQSKAWYFAYWAKLCAEVRDGD